MINIHTQYGLYNNTPFAFADQVVVNTNYTYGANLLYLSAYAYHNGVGNLVASNNRTYSNDYRALVCSDNVHVHTINIDNISINKKNYLSKVTRIPNNDIYKIVNIPKRDEIEGLNNKQMVSNRFSEKSCVFYIETSKVIDILLNGGISEESLVDEFYMPSSRFKNILLECPEIHHEIFKLVKNVTSIPFIEEWVQYVLNYNDRALKICWSSAMYNDIHAPGNIYAAVVKINGYYIKEAVSEGLKTGRIQINGCRTASSVSKSIHNLTDYLSHFSNQLITKASNKFTACFDPGKNDFSDKEKDFFDYADYFGKLKLYNAQKNVVAAVSRALDKNRSAFVVGEMGCGSYTCQ